MGRAAPRNEPSKPTQEHNNELCRRLMKINNLAVGYQEHGPFDDPREGFDRMAEIYRLSLIEEGDGQR
jgi:hypothetical protein